MPHSSEWLTLLFVPVILLMLYRRLRRTFGEQPVQPRRMIFRMVMLPLVCVAFLITAPTAPSFGAAAAGAIAGLVLAFVALKRTTFQAKPEGRFYTPNPWLGLIVLALVLGRVAARLVAVSSATAAPPDAAFSGAQRSPATLGLFFLMAAYYVTYYGGVLRKSRAVAP